MYRLTSVDIMYTFIYTHLINMSIYRYTMVVKKIVISQYKGIVDRAAALIAGLKTPPEGWLRTVRKALGMSVVQLAAKLGVTRALV